MQVGRWSPEVEGLVRGSPLLLGSCLLVHCCFYNTSWQMVCDVGRGSVYGSPVAAACVAEEGQTTWIDLVFLLPLPGPSVAFQGLLG